MAITFLVTAYITSLRLIYATVARNYIVHLCAVKYLLQFLVKKKASFMAEM